MAEKIVIAELEIDINALIKSTSEATCGTRATTWLRTPAMRISSCGMPPLIHIKIPQNRAVRTVG